MPRLILIVFLVFAAWLIRRDTARRDGISGAVWIPTIWIGILASRPFSTWLGSDAGGDALEGSPLDRLFFFAFIFLAFIVISRRRVSWSQVISTSWPVFLFYAFMLISVLWAYSPVASFKRWFKDFGNISVALVILTEVNPAQAFRAVYVRCAYVLIPLSYIFIRWFPDMGRHYNIHSGGLEATGVTFQKNSLGIMVLACGLILIWDWLERSKPGEIRQNWFDRYMPLGILAIGLYLLHLCDSKTSIACLAFGSFILSAIRIPFLRNRVGSLGVYIVASAAIFFVLDSLFGIKEFVVESMGRNMTFTGRTDVWKVLLDLHTPSILGTGFCDFWSDPNYLPKLPYWVEYSAHNGYLETYLDGGIIGVFFLVVLLIGTGLKINRQLSTTGGSYPLIRFVVLGTMIIGNITESHFGRMSPLWFMLLLVALDPMPGGGIPGTSEIFASDPQGAPADPEDPSEPAAQPFPP
jgi:exopolysaccharide production protein ExoQ